MVKLNFKPNQNRKPTWKQGDPKGKKQFEISKAKCFSCNQYGHFARDFPNKKDQSNMIKEEEETTYLNDSHMDLLCASEEECAMVAQDSPSCEGLDDSIVTYGQQNSEKENSGKIHYESIFEQESSSEEEMSNYYPGKKADESTHVTKHPGEKVFCREQSMWHEGDDGKTAFEREQMKIIRAKF